MRKENFFFFLCPFACQRMAAVTLDVYSESRNGKEGEKETAFFLATIVGVSK